MQINKKRLGSYIIIAALALVLVWLSVTAMMRASGNRSAIAGGRCPVIRVAWKSLVDSIRAIGFSHNGRFAYVITADGVVRIYSAADGKCRLIKLPSGMNRVAVSFDAKYIMAYPHLDPANSNLVFLNQNGDTYWKKDISGAVWCVDTCPTKDGTKFFVGTGEGYVYILEVGKQRKRYKRFRVPGAVISLYVDDKGENITVGTWQSSTVARYTITGKQIWKIDGDRGSLQYVQPMRWTDNLLVSSIPNRAGVDGVFTLYDAQGSRLWQGTIDVSQKTRVCPSADGNYVCLGYDKLIIHKGESMREKHSMLYSSSGRMLWDKGSSFFQSEPIMVTRNGYVLLCQEDNALFTISPQGELKQSIKLSASVNRSISSRDGSCVLLYCSDGKLYMLAVS